jgi:hypothetical protein
MNLDLRPLTVSEFLDRTFSIYRHRFLLFVGLMAPQAVLSLAFALVWGWATVSMQGAAPELGTMVALAVGAGLGFVLFLLANWVLYVLGVGATTSAVSDLYGRLTPDVGAAFSAAKGRLGPLLWMTFLMAVRLFGVLALCAMPGGLLLGLAGGANAFELGSTASVAVLVTALVVLGLGSLIGFGIMLFMALRYAVAIPAVMLEPIGGREAIRRSIRLTRGLLLRALLLMICAGIIGYAAAMVLQMPFVIAMVVVGIETRTGFWLNMAGTATGMAGRTMTAPIVAIGVVVLYFEARIRHEAFDLQVMTEALAPVPVPPAVAPGFATAPPPVPH